MFQTMIKLSPTQACTMLHQDQLQFKLNVKQLMTSKHQLTSQDKTET